MRYVGPGVLMVAALVTAPSATAGAQSTDSVSPVDAPDPAPAAPAPAPTPTPTSGTDGSGRDSLHPDATLAAIVATPYAGGDYGVGALFAFGAGWGRIPVAVGADMMGLYWGSQDSDILIPTGTSLLPARLHRVDETVSLELWVRVQPPYWIVRPYLEGFAGGRVLQSSYSLTFAGSSTSTDTNSDTDTAGQIGWGVGVDVNVFKDHSIALTLGYRSVTGAKGSFIRTESSPSGNVLVQYDVATDTNVFLLGIAARFDALPRGSGAP